MQSSVDWAVWTALLRKAGYEVFADVRALSLGSHMDVHFHDGLRKLDIGPEIPDALKCALYHVLSNALGGVNTSYAVESDDKVWLFYHSQSISHALLRPGAWIKQMRAWHARDGLALGNRGLAWVATHFTELGDPYRAGYFVDYHRDLDPEERFQVRIGEDPPEGLAMQFPEYDEAKWPAERRMKAFRNYSRDYASSTILSVVRTQPSELAAEILELAMRTVLFAMDGRLLGAFQLQDETAPVARVARFIACFEEATGTSVAVDVSEASATLEIDAPSAFSAKEWQGAADELRAVVASALARAWSVWASYVAPGILVSVSPDGRHWEVALSPIEKTRDHSLTKHGNRRWTEEQLLSLM
jgi:hypothetical protein